MSGARAFSFLNEAGTLTRDDWEETTRSKLWLYNLHYFDDLNAADAPARDAWHIALMDDWITHHSVGGTGWEPYPCSLRIVNWIKRHLDGRPLSVSQRDSLAAQARWLTQRLEWHLLGNHLFVNAKALVFAGLFFDGPESERWLAKGLAILAEELHEQVLPDGGNFERSPMYHAIFLEDVLDMLNAASAFPGRVPADTVDGWRRTASRMTAWLRAVCHPDGEISLFNDAAIGIAPPPQTLLDYAARVGVDAPVLAWPRPAGPVLTALPDSGYLRVDLPVAVALLDVAPIGPDYLPGHAHADTLSFELSVFGERAIVNGGTSRYGLGPERLRERGTAAHSTVIIDGQDSSEVWGGFRVARRARPVGLCMSVGRDEAVVACAHDGYRRLPGRPEHHREWHWRTAGLTVSDRVTGRFCHAQARYHFHPGVRVEDDGEHALRLTLPSGGQLRLRTTQGALRLESSSYASKFGQVVDTTCAVVELRDAQARVDFDWT
ncbi:heparinase II/III family protein [Pelomonas sp. P7]|uniref:Heparinase II/III family protein n=1 Tax=Pelomonas caseinilytica TaxID=2906763 RepID=A0ABS8XLP7_9BURK|nr:heparinase II/III family protein [Pelomonas sp. P7]MCE4538155.1 heparinase II/III family protein [Pelomonas sp. P7]